MLNDYFASQCNVNSSVNSEINDGEDDDVNLTASACELSDVVVTDSAILKALKMLDANKASGPDGIHNIVIKNCAETIIRPLKIIFSRSLEEGIFPSIWKNANICPVYKKGDKQLVANYRPIALLSNLSKVLERLVYNELYKYCEVNNILTERNSGFKKSDSAINQLIYLNHLIYQGLDDGKKIALLFLDVSRAFDSVWHQGCSSSCGT